MPLSFRRYNWVVARCKYLSANSTSAQCISLPSAPNDRVTAVTAKDWAAIEREMASKTINGWRHDHGYGHTTSYRRGRSDSLSDNASDRPDVLQGEARGLQLKRWWP